MRSSRPLHRAAALAARRPALVLALTAAARARRAGVRAAPAARRRRRHARRHATARAYAATATLRERFGDDAIIVLVRGDLQKLLLSQDLERAARPRGLHRRQPAGGRDAARRRERAVRRGSRARKPVKVVLGPGTFVNTAVRELRARLRAARAARARARATPPPRRRATRGAAATGLGARRGAAPRGERARGASRRASPSELVDARGALRAARRCRASTTRTFVSTLVFDAAKPPGTPKRKFAYLFPVQAARGRAARRSSRCA